jgi:hypothetical protein
VRLNARALAGAIWQYLDRFQTACRLAPPDAIVRLLKLTLLAHIKDRQHNQPDRGNGKQRQQQTIEEASFHGGSALCHLTSLHVDCHVGEGREFSTRIVNRLRMREIVTSGFKKRQPEREEYLPKMQETVDRLH